MESTPKIDQTFIEDPLRVLRGIRIAAKYNLSISPATYDAMNRNANRLSIISRERIAAEFDKMLTCDNVEYALRTLWEIGAMRYVVEEYADIKPKMRMQFYKRLKYARNCDYKTKLAIFLYNAVNPEKAMRELKYSNDIIDDVMFIIKQRDFLENHTSTSSSDVRELQYKCKTAEMFHRVVIAHACATVEYIEDGYFAYKTNWDTESDMLVKEKTDMFGYRLPVNGEDVMKELGIGPSAGVRVVLNALIMCAYHNPKISKTECLDKMRNLII